MEIRRQPKTSTTLDELAVVQAAAWAWYQHGSGSEAKPVREFDLIRTQTAPRPSRFKLEADENTKMKGSINSLLDPYEVGRISKHLEYLIESSNGNQDHQKDESSSPARRKKKKMSIRFTRLLLRYFLASFTCPPTKPFIASAKGWKELYFSFVLTLESRPSMAARNAILKHLRVNVQVRNATPFTFSFNNIFPRHFSAEVRGSFLDKSEVSDRVISVVKNFQKVDPSKVTPNAHFQNDLGLDSLDTVEIVMALEEEFGFEIPDSEADKINTINLAVDFIASHPQAK
ncbi:hypothetical protein NE237_005973 [Protea cynaroides]|uniref:Acyl carrier protein n=1 Tax=Protea cynaroides TaxID=273540 RepID=A0A9Q0KLQ0_9MAGN|nr:hypothetical protein NE237_005973 [Protea cynaroides]